MTHVFDLYGFSDEDIDTVAEKLARVLEVAFEPHESSFWGEYYVARREEPKEKYNLKDNFNEMEDDWNEPSFQEYPLIMTATFDSPVRADEIEKRLLEDQVDMKITLLRRDK